MKLKASHSVWIILFSLLVGQTACQCFRANKAVAGGVPTEVVTVEPDSTVKYVPYDEPPRPIGGNAAILRNVVYPKQARDMKIEGMVVVQAFINAEGRVEICKMLKGLPNTGLDEAAVDALKKTAFKPAKQEGTPVGVWIAVPIVFRLDDKPAEAQQKNETK